MALWIRVALLEGGIVLMYLLVRILFPYFMKEEKASTARTFKRVGIALYAVHATGIFLNIATFTVNGGMMPVAARSFEAMNGKGTCDDSTALKYDGQIHFCADSTTRLPALADRFIFMMPINGRELWSIGDVLGYAGIGALLCFIPGFLVPIYIRDLIRKNSP